MRPLLLILLILSSSSYFMTWILRYIYTKKKIFDIPNDRSSHSEPITRGGGLAIVISWYAGITFLFFRGSIDNDLYFAFLPGVLLAVISLIDDVVDLKPSIRLITQIITIVVTIIILGGFRNFQFFAENSISQVILYFLLVIGMVWFINLYNFLDGIDGYASLEAICLSIAFLLLTGDILNVLLIAAVTGFLIWNWPQAKIFMGDVGSTQLGFIIAVLGLHYHNEGSLSIVWWLVLTSPFWFDATVTLFRRWRNKENLSTAHRKHMYQRLVQSGFSHLNVDFFLLSLNAFLILIVIFCSNYEWTQIPVALFTVVLLSIIMVIIDRRNPFIH